LFCIRNEKDVDRQGGSGGSKFSQWGEEGHGAGFALRIQRQEWRQGGGFLARGFGGRGRALGAQGWLEDEGQVEAVPERAQGARAGCDGTRRGGGAGGQGLRGKLAGAPKLHEVLEAGEQADQGGADEGVHRRQHAPVGGMPGGLRAQVGQEADEGLGREWRGGC